MNHQNKKALELSMRDAMDGLEQLASLYAYDRLPEDLEILSIGPEEFPEPAPTHCAEVLPFRPQHKSHSKQAVISKASESAGANEKYNKIIIL